MFASMRVAVKQGMKAPHKTILLLSVIELIEDGFIQSNHIKLSDKLIEKFKQNWNKYVGNSTVFQADIGKPFWHLQSEPFWKLISHNGIEVTKDNISGSKYSISNLRKNVAYAEIDKELFELLKNRATIERMKTLIFTIHLDRNYA